MKFKIFGLIVAFIFIVSLPILAQENLTLEDTIRIGLERNFGILIAKNEAEIAANNHSLGNAGFLPVIDLTASLVETQESLETTGSEQGLASSNRHLTDRNLTAELGWTIFDGLKMFTTYSRLGELRKLGETIARIQIEDTITDIVVAYYNIVRVEKQLEVLSNTVETSRERLRIAEAKWELGSGSEYDFLLARTDFNADSAAVIREEVELWNARMELIRLLDFEVDTEFNVDSDIELDDELIFDDLYSQAMMQNQEIEAARINKSVSKHEVNELRLGWLPVVEIGAGYYIDRDINRNSSLTRTSSDGYFYGVTASFRLFNGLNTRREIENARIRERNSELILNEQANMIETALTAEYRNYSNTRRLIGLEMENLEIAERSLNIALERFSLGTTTSIELRESQRALLDTETRLITAQFEAKISETELLRLSGSLIDQFDAE